MGSRDAEGYAADVQGAVYRHTGRRPRAMICRASAGARVEHVREDPE